jgi:hypothetical protein
MAATTVRARTAPVALPSAVLEPLAALALCLLAAYLINRRLLQPNVFSDDAFVHQYWMWHWRDARLFNDPLTAELRDSARYPPGYVAMFWVVTHVTSPIVAGEWLGVALMGGSAWLVFLIARECTDWRPAGWIAAALFLSLLDIHRFQGGFPRAFVHPAVLLTVLLLLRDRAWLAALAAGLSALIYPPAAVLAVGVMVFCGRKRPGPAALAVAVSLAAVLAPGRGGAVLTAAQARHYPDFGAQGPLRFFVPSMWDYLRENRSGFDLRTAGWTLAIVALALLATRAVKLRREVAAMAIVAVAAWGLAQLVLFRLYLPHRYTYPLVAFFPIVVAVAVLPVWERFWRWRFALLLAPVVAAAITLYLLPLGPTDPFTVEPEKLAFAAGGVAVAAAGAFLLPRPAAGALASCAVLLVVLLACTKNWARGNPCPTGPAVQRLAQLPKDAIVAGDPIDMKCLPGTTRRAVVISTQLAPSYEVEYFKHGRRRMFDTLRAVYGPDREAIVALNRRYGATDLWVKRSSITQELRHPKGIRWHDHRMEPYGRLVRDLGRGGKPPASLSLPAECRIWRHGADEIYDIPCVASSPS